MTSIPRLHSVNSSNLKSVGYSKKTSTLYVRFKNSSLYAYPSFQYSDYLALRKAESIGKAFNANIRPLPYQRIK